MTSAPPPKKRRWVLGLGALLALAIIITVVSVLNPGTKTPPIGQGPGATTSAPAPTTKPGKPAGCPDVQFLYVPGTYETNAGADPSVPVPSFKAEGPALAQRFQGQSGRLSEYFVPYLAQFNNPTPYFASEQDGVRATTAAIAATAQRCPGASFLVVGYSQGAAVAGDVATTIGQGGGVISPDKLLGVGLISDPNRNPATEKLIGAPVVGAGLAGPRPKDFGAVGDRVITFCAPGDLICATPASAANLANLPATLALIGQYLQSGVHTSYGTYQVAPGTSAMEWLTDWAGDKIAKAPKG